MLVDRARRRAGFGVPGSFLQPAATPMPVPVQRKNGPVKSGIGEGWPEGVSSLGSIAQIVFSLAFAGHRDH